MSSPTEWPEIERLFFGALGIPASARDTWIENHAGNPILVDEVRSLLRAHAESEGAPAPQIGPYRLEKLIARF